MSFGGSVGLPEAEEFVLGCNGIRVVFDASEDIELEDETADDIREGEKELETIEDANSEEFGGGAEKKQFPNALWHPAPQKLEFPPQYPSIEQQSPNSCSAT
jgi:hypothetical protein